jgi:hypothetical protein
MNFAGRGAGRHQRFTRRANLKKPRAALAMRRPALEIRFESVVLRRGIGGDLAAVILGFCFFA